MVVKLVNCQVLVLLILSVQTFFVNAGNFAPVLLWTSESLNLANPFERTTKVEFENVLNKNLGKERPPVLVFVKNNFCIEDITLNKKNFQVLSKAGPVSYFSAVESPVTAFSDLSSYQVHTSNDLHDFVEGQIYLIDINDISEIPNSEFIQVTRSKNLIVAVTGKSCKLFSPKRSKREVGVETTASSKNLTVKNADVLLYAEEYPMIKVNTDPFKRLGNMINSRFNKTGGKLEIDFDAGENGLQKLTLTFDFKGSAGYYKLDTISVPLTANEKDKAILKVKDVYFPMNSSYHCSRNNVFSNYKKDSPVILSIKNLQIQIGHEGKFSDDVYSCVGFTSIPIWTGIFVTAILVLILMWGLTMIMDIRTMDRFDDPKGKTIAISAQD